MLLPPGPGALTPAACPPSLCQILLLPFPGWAAVKVTQPLCALEPFPRPEGAKGGCGPGVLGDTGTPHLRLASQAGREARHPGRCLPAAGPGGAGRVSQGALAQALEKWAGVAALFPSPRTKAAEHKQHLPEGKGSTQRRGGGGLFPRRKAAPERGAPFPVLGLGRRLRQPRAPAHSGVRRCHPAARRGKAAPMSCPLSGPPPAPVAMTTPMSAAVPHLQSAGAAVSLLVGIGARSGRTAAATQQAPPRGPGPGLSEV